MELFVIFLLRNVTDGFVLTLTACITITYQDNIFSLTLLKAMPQAKLINTLTKSQLPYFVGFKLFGFIAADRPCYQKKFQVQHQTTSYYGA